MTSKPSRRAFLKGAFKESPTPRPFGALSEAAFRDACTKCGDCLDACPEGIIFNDDAGYPIVDVRNGACTFCEECMEACETGALIPDQPWPWQAQVASSCLSMNAVSCRTCQDFCDHAAIRFQLQTGGKAVPSIDSESCVGCGGCVSACPVGAVKLNRTPQNPEVHAC